jgi:hypothetical protein
MSDEIRVVLAGPAKVAHDQMLRDAKADGKTKINSSKLINWIVVDYFNLMFDKRKQQLCKEHFDSRKCVLEALKTKDSEAIRQALEEAAKNLAHPPSKRPSKARHKDSNSNDASLEKE